VELSEEGLAFLVRHEGRRNRPYQDALGHCTVGVGHLLHLGRCTEAELQRVYSDAEVDAFLRDDIRIYVAAVNDLVHVPLSQRQFDALVSFAFNWGIGEVGGFPATSVLAFVNQGRFTEAAADLVTGRGPRTRDWPQGRPYDKGLEGVRRRREEEAAWLRGEPMSTVDIIRAAMADLEAQGVPVVYVVGWEGRSTGTRPVLDPAGVVIHHTATRSYDYDYPSLGIVRDGRSDLPGPLSQFGLGRHTGTVYVIASGKANHAGPGGWNGLSGNASVWGIEAENDGIGEEWSDVTLRNYVLLCAALARHTGFGPENVCCHREWTSAKIDPTGIDGDWFRAQVAAALEGNFTTGGFPMALSEQEQRDLANRTEWTWNAVEQIKEAVDADQNESLVERIARQVESRAATAGGTIDLDELADRLADRLAERLQT
jgi:GH24 family phage-related lysozyme (muramidase)